MYLLFEGEGYITKAIYTYIDHNGEEKKEEVKGVIFAAKNKEVMYPDGTFYSSFRIESRIENRSMEVDIIPGSRLEFVCE